MVREKMPQEPLITYVKPRTIDADVLQLLIHSVQVLIAQYPPKIIIAVMNDLQASYLARWRKRQFLLLPVYYALASLIFLTDIVATNAFFHRFFTALYLPVPERGGWYYSAFLAILCQSYCLLPLIQVYFYFLCLLPLVAWVSNSSYSFVTSSSILEKNSDFLSLLLNFTCFL